MKSISSLLTTLTLSLVVSSQAFAQVAASDVGTDKITSLRNILADLNKGDARVEAGKRLMVKQSINARLYKNLDSNSTDKMVNLPEGTELEVLDVSRDGKVAHIGIDSNLSSMSDLHVSISDLESRDLAEINTTEIDEDEDVEEGLFAAKKSTMTYCYRDVKNTLLRAKKCGRYASGERAMQGYDILKAECGMIQVGKVTKATDLAKLPTYSVCVSGGGRSCGKGLSCGHIAIKLPSGLWFGAGTRASPYLGDSKKAGYKPRYVIGCLKPKGSK